jgi:hypothetical protein
MDNLTLDQAKVETIRVCCANDLEYLDVAPSPIQGLGLFTSKNLPAYQNIFTITGKKVYRTYHPVYASLNPNWLGTGYQEWLEINEGDISVYINHSCSPNVIVNEHLQVITLRRIRKGEELLLDYSTTELDPYWSMKCTCGEPCCRKTLLSFQYLPIELQHEYDKYLSTKFRQQP